jgi:hypothetical protein
MNVGGDGLIAAELVARPKGLLDGRRLGEHPLDIRIVEVRGGQEIDTGRAA